MDEQRIFVGRQAELDRFREILEDPRGQAIVVVGQTGMGKTWLIDRMAQLATQHPTIKCAWVRYEVTPTDSPDSTMALMMDNAFEAAQTCEGSFDMTDRRRAQWNALLKTFVPKGRDLAELLASLRRDPQKHTREQFLERLRLISKRMESESRALFVVDPEKYMCSGSADSWRLVTRELPNKIKFLFAQRPEDQLIGSNSFMALENVERLPAEPLGVLAAEEVDDLVRLRAAEVGQPTSTLQEAMNRYRGHPYAIQAALEIVKKTKHVEDLPQDPTNEGIAATQWQQICRTGEDAIRLFEAHAILEVAVPRDIVQAVSGLDTPTLKRLLSDPYLNGLLREEGQGQCIYHAILADHVRGQIDQAGQQALHARAIHVYRTSLKEAREQNKAPDALAAVRLPEHVLAAEGPSAFVATFVNECTGPLLTLGLLDIATSVSHRCRGLVEKGTNTEAAVIGNQALILQDRGELDEAMTLLKEQERICRQLRNLHGLSVSLGSQASILRIRGNLNGAMALLKKQERISRRLGDLDGLSRSRCGEALILETRGDLDGAMALYKEVESICRQLGDLGGLSRCLGDQAVVLWARGGLTEAMALLKEQERICRQLGDLDGLSVSLGNQGVLLRDRGDLDQAMALHKEDERICRQLGNLDGLQRTLGNQALILQDRGDLDEAMALLRKQKRICCQLGNLYGLSVSLVPHFAIVATN
jgi:tetratricopeptide (TPR) repeat protein